MKNVFLILLFSFIIFSCGTNPTETPQNNEFYQNEVELNNNNDINSSDNFENENSSSIVSIIETNIYESDIKDFIELCSEFKINKIAEPEIITAGSSFKSYYVIQVKDSDDNAASDFPIGIKFPIKKDENGLIIFDIIYKRTDKNGNLFFLPPPSKNAFDSTITFFFETKNKSQIFLKQIENEILQNSVSFPFKVKTALCTKGGAIALVDFSSDNQPIINNSISSSALLISLYKKGFSNVGNFPDIINEVITNDSETIFKNAKQVLYRNAFFIYGTIKYNGEIKLNTENKTEVSLLAKVRCFNMENNETFFETEIYETGHGKDEMLALKDAREKIADNISEKMLFGM